MCACVRTYVCVCLERVSGAHAFEGASHLLGRQDMAEVEGDGDGRNSPTFQSRYEKSLGLLTTKFVNLLQSSSGGVLDLKKVHVSASIISCDTHTHTHT